MCDTEQTWHTINLICDKMIYLPDTCYVRSTNDELHLHEVSVTRLPGSTDTDISTGE
jgi:hypothetical protein